MANYTFLLTIFASCLLLCFSFSRTSLNSNRLSARLSIKSRLYGRASKVEEKESSGSVSDDGEDETIQLPYTGIIGTQGGNLFEKPLEVYDPTKEIMDVPGEDGSDEQAKAMQRKIQERVDALRKSGQYEENDEEFGADPLSKTPLYAIMLSQLKAAKPFETWDEFGLTYILVFIGTAFLSGYVYAITQGIDGFIEWFEKTDFDFIGGFLQ